jgi:NADPH2:quinone reductase
MAERIIIDSIGGPEVLRFIGASPAEPGPGEVLVDLFSIGVNRSDVAFRSGKYLVQPEPPCGLGVEGAGVVKAVGQGVTDFASGDRVSILPTFLPGRRYATYVRAGVFPAASLLPIPASVDNLVASAVWVSYLTAWGALVELGGLNRGDFVLISAASSSVGLSAIQIANAVGATPIATTRSSAKIAALRQAGAAHVIASEEQDVPEAIRAITGDKGLRLAFDAIAGPFTESLVPCMADEGTIFFYGGLSDQRTMFDRRPIIRKGISFTGYTVWQILRHADRRERGRSFVLTGLADGTLTPVIDRIFPFEEAVEAHRYIESNVQFGKIVMAVGKR